MGWSIRKPLGNIGSGAKKALRKNVNPNSVLGRVISKPLATAAGASIGGIGAGTGGALGAGFTDMKANAANKQREYDRQLADIAAQQAAAQGDLEAMAQLEEQKRTLLGQKQRQQILDFAGDTEKRASDFRGGLANSLANTSQSYFQRLNPYIMEDLNSRGLFTSQTARDQEQTNALQEIAEKDQAALRAFDTDIFGQLNDIRGTALSAELGGDQSALDSSLDLRKASIQRRFDEADAAREQAFSEMLARRKSRDSLVASILGLGGTLGAGALGRG